MNTKLAITILSFLFLANFTQAARSVENNKKNTPNSSVYWQKFEGEIPNFALVGGYEADGTKQYVCRADYMGGKHPGKLVGNKCNISYGGKEIVLTDFEILIDKNKETKWISWTGNTPTNALKACYENGTTLYICRADYMGGKHIGKLVNGNCNIPYGGKEIIIKNNFEILTLSQTENFNFKEDKIAANTHFFTKKISIPGNSYVGYDFPILRRYGYTPNICYYANPDNSVDIAWWSQKENKIYITQIDKNGNKTNEFLLDYIPPTQTLMGITKIPSDNSFVIAYSANLSNASNPKIVWDTEYWISRCDANGNKIFNTLVFGNHYGEMKEDVNPGSASTGRIAYNEQDNLIVFFLGHNKKWDDGVTHQGGYLGFMSLDGKQLKENDGKRNWGSAWLYSHNFDQRLLLDGNKYIILNHGDGYERALNFQKWEISKSENRAFKLYSKCFLDIPGRIGDNVTDTQLGGIIKLADGNYGVVFTTSIGRTRRDVCYKKLDSKGNILAEKWLTNYKKDDAVYPRIANLNNHILIAWELYSENKVNYSFAYFTEINTEGETLKAPKMQENVILTHVYDLINLPNGDVFWVTPNEDNSLTINKIELQK